MYRGEFKRNNASEDQTMSGLAPDGAHASVGKSPRSEHASKAYELLESDTIHRSRALNYALRGALLRACCTREDESIPRITLHPQSGGHAAQTRSKIALQRR